MNISRVGLERREARSLSAVWRSFIIGSYKKAIYCELSVSLVPYRPPFRLDTCGHVNCSTKKGEIDKYWGSSVPGGEDWCYSTSSAASSSSIQLFA